MVFLLGGWLWCAPLAPAAEEEPARVSILYGAHVSYQKAAASLEASLKAQGTKCSLIALPKGKDPADRRRVREELLRTKPAVIATAGTAATSFAIQQFHDVPVVFFMVPNARDASFLNGNRSARGYVGGVTTDVSPEDQIGWILKLHPACKRIAVFHSGRTRKTVEALQSAASRRGVTIVPIKADKGRFPEAIDSLEAAKCDGILMVPDAKVYNSASVQRVLLWGIRHKKPVWAFSESIVKAGALAGQYVDSHEMARQAADLVHNLICQEKSLSTGLHYPRQFKTAVNEHTAAMIKVSLGSPAVGRHTIRFGGKP